MTKAYSEDLRERVIAAVESGATPACRGGAVQGKRQLCHSLGAALADGLGNRRQAARRQRLTAGGSCGGGGRLGGRTAGPGAGRILRGFGGAQDRDEPSVGVAFLQPSWVEL